MTDHPSTYNAVTTDREGVQWDDQAALHRADDGEGLFDGAKALNRGTLAEMVRIVMAYPEHERREYVIEKAGDHALTVPEIEALAARDDFPG